MDGARWLMQHSRTTVMLYLGLFLIALEISLLIGAARANHFKSPWLDYGTLPLPLLPFLFGFAYEGFALPVSVQNGLGAVAIFGAPLALLICTVVRIVKKQRAASIVLTGLAFVLACAVVAVIFHAMAEGE